MSSIIPVIPNSRQSHTNTPNTPTNPLWRKAALATVKRLARRRETLISTDVLDQLARSDVTTTDLRAIGGVMREACALGYIESSGLVRQRSNKHSRSISTLWRSLLYQQKNHS